MGSVSTGLVHHAQCPVAVIPLDEARHAPSRYPVLLGVDGTAASEGAIAVAFDEAARRSAGLIEPLRTVLSTQEAANLLGISRPTLVKLLESGEIAFIKPGRHRRVELQHLLDYQRHLRKHRGEELATIATEAADDDAYRAINGFTGTR
jgi:excisionase family DNA binding protein